MHFDEPLIDALREHGATDEHLKLLKNFDAVKYLLETLHHEYDGDCVECGSYVGDKRRAHYRTCKTLEALCALGLDSMKMELERAEHEAREEHARRTQPQRRTPNNTRFVVNPRDFENMQRLGVGAGAEITSNPLVPEGTMYQFDESAMRAPTTAEFNEMLKRAFNPDELDQRLYENNPLTGLIGRKKP